MSSLVHSLTGLMTAVVIPIVAIVGGMSFAAYSMYLKVRRQRETLQMYHLERMAAIEKGIELPPLPPELLPRGYSGAPYGGDYKPCRRNSGVTLLFVGVAATVAMWQSSGDHQFWWGLVIIAWGLGRLVTDYLDRSGAPRVRNDGPMGPGSGFNR